MRDGHADGGTDLGGAAAAGRSGSLLGSLRTRLLLIWLLSLAASVTVGLLLEQVQVHAAEAQRGRTEAVVANACAAIGDRYAFLTAGWAGPPGAVSADPGFRRRLLAVLRLALADEPALGGGVWQDGAGTLAAVAPSGESRADAAAAASREAALAAAAVAGGVSLSGHLRTEGGTLLVTACPLGGPVPFLAAWASAWSGSAGALTAFRVGLAVLLGLLLLVSVSLGWTLLLWTRRVSGIEAVLRAATDADLPPVALTGEAELDRVVGALNEAGRRLAAVRREAEALAARAARSERAAGLARVAAGVAHEIRNPIAAARLAGENALAGGPARHAAALGTMIGQLDRLDALVDELLAMTQRREPAVDEAPIGEIVAAVCGRARDAAGLDGPSVEGECAGGSVRLDRAMTERALDNLLANAVRHTPPGGSVRLAVERGEGVIRFVVSDTGAGVAPALAGSLFEPFVTGRADGTGLGLAIARELAVAQGGRLALRSPGGGAGGRAGDPEAGGAVFVLELPDREPQAA